MLIQANTPNGRLVTVDMTQLESIWTESLEHEEADSEVDNTVYYAMGVSGTVYHLSGLTYRNLLENWKANGNL